MRTAIGTKKLAVTFACDERGIHALVWSDGIIVGVTPSVDSDTVGIYKGKKEVQIVIGGSSFWVKPRWVKVY